MTAQITDAGVLTPADVAWLRSTGIGDTKA